MTKSIILLFVLGAICACNASLGSDIDSTSNSIQDGRNAYFQMDHATAYAIFTNVWRDTNQTLADRTSAGRSLSKMDWLLYENDQQALKRLSNLQALDYGQTELFLLKSRILRGQLKWDKAILAAQHALDLSTSQTEEYHALLAYCASIFEKSKAQVMLFKGINLGDPELQKGYTLLHTMAEDKPGDVDIAKLYLGYSLLLKNGPGAFKGWMSYYRLTDPSQVHTSLVSAIDVFKEALWGYEMGNEHLKIKVIIKGLAESGFYEYAMLVKNHHYGPNLPADKELNEIANYHQFLTKTDSITKRFYLQTVSGTAKQKPYKKALSLAGKTLWDSFAWTTNAPDFSVDQFEEELNKRFKTVMEFITANGYFGLHMGHVILDDSKIIHQYEEKAEFRYVAIDHMVSNGYSGWFWDGAAETGGWANDDESFLQVRSAYTTGPVRSWQHITDSIEMIKSQKDLVVLTLKDDSLARVNPYAFLPGLSMRIAYDQTKMLLDSLSGRGLTGGALRLSFINSLERITQGASIYAHEGRHAIDKKNNTFTESEELEYTAKLSEIYFSKKPMLSFNAIMSRNIGDGTSHGNANLRVIKGLVAWIDKHQQEITSFDTQRPTLPQMDQLTDEQLRAAIRSLDPMAK